MTTEYSNSYSKSNSNIWIIEFSTFHETNNLFIYLFSSIYFFMQIIVRGET